MGILDHVAVLPPAALKGFPPANLEVRPRRLGAAVGGSIATLLAIAAALAPFLLEERSWIAVMFGFWIAAFSGMFGWLLLRHVSTAGAPGGWVLREDGHHLLVNLRSHLNTHFDPSAPSVLVLPRCRILSLRAVYEDGVRSHVGDYGVLYQNRIRREFLDIAFEGDVAAVTAALAQEGSRRGKAMLGSFRFNHSALKILPGGELRIAWRDETNRLCPDLETVCRELRRQYRFADSGRSRQAPIESLDAAARDARLLEMVTRGERLEAVKLAKTSYGMSTTEAVRFVDDLKGRGDNG